MRKLFGTDGVRGVANVHPMTPEVAMKLGKAAAHVLSSGNNGRQILIGKDTRLSGYMLETALTAGILAMGVNVLLVGPMPTPAVAHLTKSFAADAGIVISASHNPADDNGIKFFTSDGLKLSDKTEEKIERLFFSKEIRAEHVKGNKIGKASRIDDARGRYIEFSKATIDNTSLKGLKIVLDCSNGAAYDVTPVILRELGAKVIVLNDKPDGQNINLGCGAMFPEKMQEAVKKQRAHVGLALDGDADRVIMADEKGNIIDGDRVIAIAAIHKKKKKELNKNTVVVTQYTNLGFDTAMKKRGINTIRVENGDRYVVDAMLKHKLNLGGEKSGHIIFSDFISAGDGTISALQILRIMKEEKKKISQLANCFKAFPQVQLNIAVRKKKEISKMPKVKAAIKDAEKKLGKSGRVFVRYSGTENLMRVMLEGKNPKTLKIQADNIAAEVITEVGA